MKHPPMPAPRLGPPDPRAPAHLPSQIAESGTLCVVYHPRVRYASYS
jgi:hypothetical protein